MSDPVSPEDVIARELAHWDRTPALTATAALAALARAGFVVVPSEPTREDRERVRTALDQTPIRSTYATAMRESLDAALDAFLAPYRPTEDR